MKQIKYSCIAILLCAGLAFYSCEKQDSTADLNLNNSHLLDSFRILSGKERVRLTGSLKGHPELATIRISWNQGEEIGFPASQSRIDTIIGVAEGITLFTIASYNAGGTLLDKSVVMGTSYGEQYRGKLRSRPILLADYSPASGAVTLTWDKEQFAYSPLYTEVVYNDKELICPVSEEQTVLPGYDISGSVVKYRSIFRPDSTCIDTFATAYALSEVIDWWGQAADSAQQSLLNNFYNAASKSYTKNYQTTEWGGYWPTAHVLDVLTDGYLRTGDALYLARMDDLLVGMKQKNGNKWINHYYDDMEWMALACLRAYKATGDSKFKSVSDELWQDIKGGITTDLGGGSWWNKDRQTKNACSNGPAAIFAARNYSSFLDAADLDIATRVYSWEKTTLYNAAEGSVSDHIDQARVVTLWKFTYNQGTFLGAGFELYKLTNQAQYLNDAVKAADYTVQSLTTNGVLKVEGAGGSDGGLFKGIFIRYLTRLIVEGNLQPDKKSAYLNFIRNNAETLWTKGRNKERCTFQNDWTLNTDTQTYMNCQLSGIMLLESMAELKHRGLL